MRIRNSFLNFITSFFPWIILAILGFIKIDLFISHYGSELNGLVQLTYQVFNYFGLAEMGFGSAIIFKLYQLFAKNKKKQISKTFMGAIKIYRKVGKILFFSGVIFAFYSLFFLESSEISNTYTFLLIILNSVDYFLIYRYLMPYQTLLMADQKKYKVNIILNSKLIVFKLIELVLIILNINYLIVYTIGIGFNLMAGLLVKREALKNYPWIDESAKPDCSTLKMTKDVFVHRISRIIFENTDALLLSFFKGGLSLVSIYTSYNYIISYLKEITNYVLNSPLESLGNLFADPKESNEKKAEIFNEYLSVSLFLAILFSSLFYTLILPFINIWIGKKYILSNNVVLVFTTILLFQCITTTLKSIISVTGKFKETKVSAVVSAIVNVVLSLLLVYKYQIFGVLIATAISEIIVLMPLNAKYVYENILHIKLWTYYVKIAFACLLTISLILINKFIIYIFGLSLNTFIKWGITASILSIINFIIIIVLMWLLFESFRNLIIRFKNARRKNEKKFINN